MANTSVWAKPDPDLAAIRAQMAPGPEPTVWAPMDDSKPPVLPAQTAPNVIWAPPHTAQDDAMAAQPVNIPDSGVNLHAGLEKVFPPAQQPNVTLDPNPKHQIAGATANDNMPEAMNLAYANGEPQMAHQLHLQDKLERADRKDQPYDWSQHSTMGKIGHVLSKVGNIAGNIFAPSTMAMIPGTDLNRKVEEQGLAHELNSTIGQESQNALQGANTAHINAETPEVAPEAEARIGLQNAQTEALQDKTPTPETLAQLHANAVNKAIQAGRDPSEDPTVQHLADSITSLQKQAAPKGSEHITLSGPGGRPIAANYHPDTGTYSDASGKVIANPQPYEKPNVTNVNMGNSGKLNDRQQATATAIIEGRMTPPSSFALKTPYWQDIMGSVFEQDPQFNEQRAQLRKNFAVGTQSKQVNAVNTALGHAGVLGEAIDALGNGNIKVLNKIANDLGVQTGNDAATTYNTIVHRLGPEITKAYVGAGGTAGDRGTNEKDFDYSLGPKQLKSNLGVTVKLFRSMNNSLENQWNQNKSANMPAFEDRFIMPQARQTLQKYAPTEGAQGGGNAPPRPANVSPDHHWNANGPKGAGWYR